MSLQTKHIYEFGPFRLVEAEHLLLCDGKAVPLTPKAFDLLLTLVEGHGHLLEKEELLKKVWPDTFVEEANLASNISQLRKALGDGENGHRYIETAPKRGYRFVASVREMVGEGAGPDREGQTESLKAVDDQQSDAANGAKSIARITAIIYTGLGEKDQAFKWLRQACEDRDGMLVYLNVDPLFKSLRPDPRFADLLQCVGLPQ